MHRTLRCIVLWLLAFLHVEGAEFSTNPVILFQDVPFEVALSFTPLGPTRGWLCPTNCLSGISSCYEGPKEFEGILATFAAKHVGSQFLCLIIGSQPLSSHGSLEVNEMNFSPRFVLKNQASVLTFPKIAPNPMQIFLASFAACVEPFESGALSVVDWKLNITLSETVSYYICALLQGSSGPVLVNVGSFSVFSGFSYFPRKGIRYDQTLVEVGGASPAYTNVKVSRDENCMQAVSNVVRTGGAFGKTANLFISGAPGDYFMCIEAPPNSGSFAKAGPMNVRAYTFAPATFIAEKPRTLHLFDAPEAGGPPVGATVFAASDVTCLNNVSLRYTSTLRYDPVTGNHSTEVASVFQVNNNGTYFICVSKEPRGQQFVPTGNITVLPGGNLGVDSISIPVVRGLPFNIKLTSTSPESAKVQITDSASCGEEDDDKPKFQVSVKAFKFVASFTTTIPAGRYYICISTPDFLSMVMVRQINLLEFNLRFDFIQFKVAAQIQADNRTLPGTRFYFRQDDQCTLTSVSGRSTGIWVYRPPLHNYIAFPSPGSWWLCVEALNAEYRWYPIVPVYVATPVVSFTKIVIVNVPIVFAFSPHTPKGAIFSLSASREQRCTGSMLFEEVPLLEGKTAPLVVATASISDQREVIPITLCIRFPSNITRKRFVAAPLRVGNGTLNRITLTRTVFRLHEVSELRLRVPGSHVLPEGQGMTVYSTPSIVFCPLNLSFGNVTTRALMRHSYGTVLLNKNVTFHVPGNHTVCLLVGTTQVYVGVLQVFRKIQVGISTGSSGGSGGSASFVAGLPNTLFFPEGALEGVERIAISRNKDCNQTFWISELLTGKETSIVISASVPPGQWALCTLQKDGSYYIFNSLLGFDVLRVFPHSLVPGFPIFIKFENFDAKYAQGRSFGLSTFPNCAKYVNLGFTPFQETTFTKLLIPGVYYACMEGVAARPPIQVLKYFTSVPQDTDKVRYAVPFRIKITSDDPRPSFRLRIKTSRPCPLNYNNYTTVQGSDGVATVTVLFPVDSIVELCVISRDKTLAIPSASPDGVMKVLPYTIPTTAIAGVPITVKSGRRRNGFSVSSTDPRCRVGISSLPSPIDYKGQSTIFFVQGKSVQYYCERDTKASSWEVLGEFRVMKPVSITTDPFPIVAGMPFRLNVSGADPVSLTIKVANDSSCAGHVVPPVAVSENGNSTVILRLDEAKSGVVCVRDRGSGEWVATAKGHNLQPRRYVMNPVETVVNVSTAITFLPEFKGHLAVARSDSCDDVESDSRSDTMSLIFPFVGRAVVCTLFFDNQWYRIGVMVVIDAPGVEQSDITKEYVEVFVGIPFTIIFPMFVNDTSSTLMFLSNTSKCDNEVLGGERRLMIQGGATFSLPVPGRSVACIVVNTGHIWPTESTVTCGYLLDKDNILGTHEGLGIITVQRHVDRIIRLPPQFALWGLGSSRLSDNYSNKKRQASTLVCPLTTDFIPYTFSPNNNGVIVLSFSEFLSDDTQLLLCIMSSNRKDVYPVGRMLAKATFDFRIFPPFIIAGVPSALYLSPDVVFAKPVFVYDGACNLTLVPITQTVVPNVIIDPRNTTLATFSPGATFRNLTMCWKHRAIGVVNIVPRGGIQLAPEADNCRVFRMVFPDSILVYSSTTYIFLARDPIGCCTENGSASMLTPVRSQNLGPGSNATTSQLNATEESTEVNVRGYDIPPEVAMRFMNQTATLCFVNSSVCTPVGDLRIFYEICLATDEEDEEEALNRSSAVNASVDFVGGAVSLQDESLRTAVAVGASSLVLLSFVIMFICYHKNRTAQDIKRTAVVPVINADGSLGEILTPTQSRWDGMFQTLFDPSAITTANQSFPSTALDNSTFEYHLDRFHFPLEDSSVQVEIQCEIVEEEKADLESVFQYTLPFAIEADRTLRALCHEEHKGFIQIMSQHHCGIAIVKLSFDERLRRNNFTRDVLDILQEESDRYNQEARVLSNRLDAQQRDRELTALHTALMSQHRALQTDENADRQDLADEERVQSMQLVLLERVEKDAITEKQRYIEQQSMLIEHQRQINEMASAERLRSPVKSDVISPPRPTYYRDVTNLSPDPPRTAATQQQRSDVTLDDSTTQREWHTVPRLERLRQGGMKLLGHLGAERAPTVD